MRSMFSNGAWSRHTGPAVKGRCSKRRASCSRWKIRIKHNRGGSDMHLFCLDNKRFKCSHISLFHCLTETLVELQAQIWIIKTAGYSSMIQYFQYPFQTFLCSGWDHVSFLAFRNSRVAISSLSLCTLKLSFVAFGRKWLYSCYMGSRCISLHVWHTMIFFLSSVW